MKSRSDAISFAHCNDFCGTAASPSVISHAQRRRRRRFRGKEWVTYYVVRVGRGKECVTVVDILNDEEDEPGEYLQVNRQCLLL